VPVYFIHFYFTTAVVQTPTSQPVNPCVPSPCGPNSQCRDIGGAPSCSCLVNYVGVPPNCRPECSINPECQSNWACIREKCQDPCPGSCGAGAQCVVINHTPVCTCPEGFTGDPFSNCYPSPPPRKTYTMNIYLYMSYWCIYSYKYIWLLYSKTTLSIIVITMNI